MLLSLFAMVSGSLFQSTIVLQKKEYLKLSFLQGNCLNVLECEVLVFDWFWYKYVCVRYFHFIVWNFVEVNQSGFCTTFLKCRPAQIVHHFCDTTCVMVAMTDISSDSPLYFFKFVRDGPFNFQGGGWWGYGFFFQTTRELEYLFSRI